MKHPDSTEWIAWLYGEVTPERRLDLEAHLAVCPDCKARVGRWRETMGILDQAAVPRMEEHTATVQVRRLRWLAAAAAVLVTGFLLGRLSGVSEAELRDQLARADARIRAELAVERETDLRSVSATTLEAMRAENRVLVAELARQIEAARDEDRAELLGVVETLDRRRAGEIAQVRGGLAQFASRAGTAFEQTQTQMRLLAGALPGETDGNRETSNQP